MDLDADFENMDDRSLDDLVSAEMSSTQTSASATA